MCLCRHVFIGTRTHCEGTYQSSAAIGGRSNTKTSVGVLQSIDYEVWHQPIEQQQSTSEWRRAVGTAGGHTAHIRPHAGNIRRRASSRYCPNPDRKATEIHLLLNIRISVRHCSALYRSGSTFCPFCGRSVDVLGHRIRSVHRCSPFVPPILYLWGLCRRLLAQSWTHVHGLLGQYCVVNGIQRGDGADGDAALRCLRLHSAVDRCRQLFHSEEVVVLWGKWC